MTQGCPYQSNRLPLLLSFLLGLSGSLLGQEMSASSPTAPYGSDNSLSTYQLVWSDEFNGSHLDDSQWVYRTDSKMLSTQLPANVSVHDGLLGISLKKENRGDKAYTGGGIISRKSFKYGYYEARLKIPPGAGWHTSFWMMKYEQVSGSTSGSQANQELDAIENDSISKTSYGVNVHRWKGGHVAFGGKRIVTPDLSTDFHVFGCEFSPQIVRYFFDGRCVQTIDVTSAQLKNGSRVPFPHGEQNIWLTCIASNLGGTKRVDDSLLPAYAQFDYIRYFAPRYEKPTDTLLQK